MIDADVVIVGAGPAGSTLAWKLREAGRHVLVLDKYRFPRIKPCAGWITPQVIESLQLDVQEYRRSCVWQPITSFRCGVIGARSHEFHYSRVVSYGIRRCEFDDYLLRRAEVDCRLGEAVGSLEDQGDHWVVNRTYRAPLLVGAGGYFCPVARMLSARVASRAPVVYAREVEFKPGPNENADFAKGSTPQLYFCRDLLGYGWCFRKGEYLNIGLGRIDKHRLVERVESFCRFLSEEGLRCAIPMRFAGHAYQAYQGSVPKLTGNRVLLIGDAAGLASPQSGEGIRPAIESALLAARVIEAVGEDFSEQALGLYKRDILKRWGTPQHALQLLPRLLTEAIGRQLLQLPWFSQRVVLDRWFLQRNLPALKG